MEKGKLEYTPNEKNLVQPCPNFPGSEPKGVNDKENFLTSDEVRKRLQSINLKPGGRLHRNALYHANRAQVDPDDLLQAAIVAAMTSRKCRTNLAIEPFIIGIMRSKVSKVIKRQERKVQLGIRLHSLDEPGTEIAGPDLIEVNEQQRRRTASAELLRAISGGDAVIAKVIDGIGHDYRGQRLATFTGIKQDDLATVRRRLKRRAATVRDQLAPDLDAA